MSFTKPDALDGYHHLRFTQQNTFSEDPTTVTCTVVTKTGFPIPSLNFEPQVILLNNTEPTKQTLSVIIVIPEPERVGASAKQDKKRKRLADDDEEGWRLEFRNCQGTSIASICVCSHVPSATNNERRPKREHLLSDSVEQKETAVPSWARCPTQTRSREQYRTHHRVTLPKKARLGTLPFDCYMVTKTWLLCFFFFFFPIVSLSCTITTSAIGILKSIYGIPYPADRAPPLLEQRFFWVSFIAARKPPKFFLEEGPQIAYWCRGGVAMSTWN